MTRRKAKISWIGHKQEYLSGKPKSYCTRLRVPIIQKYPGKEVKSVLCVCVQINQKKTTNSKGQRAKIGTASSQNEHTQMVHKIQKLKALFH